MTPAPNAMDTSRHSSRQPPRQRPPTAERRHRNTEETDQATTRLALDARDGAPEAVEHFIRAFERDVWRFVAHLSADPQSADDLTQDTFLRALRSLPRFEGRSSARTWLLSIARRTVIDSLRRQSCRPVLHGRDDWQLLAEQAQPQQIPGFEEGVALADLLASLPEDRRRAFILTQLLGLPYEQAALGIGCPVGTVRSRVARARETLAALVAESDGPAAGTRAA